MNTLFGFGTMRLPLNNKDNLADIDQEQFNQMVELYMAEGHNYFDTSYAYHDEKSESAIKEALVDKYPRESYEIADKIPTWLLKEEADNQKYVEIMLERLGINYFDKLFVHNVNQAWIKIAEKTKSFEYIIEAKEKGIAKEIGFSFHDKPELLRETLDKYGDELDFVQLEVNYLDWEDPLLEAKICYEICLEYGLDIYVMEPLKGGALANLSEDILDEFKKFNPDCSPIDYALRFVASLKNVKSVLVGMSEYSHTVDNCKIFKEFKPLTDEENEFLLKMADKIRQNIAVPCSLCGYCLKECPEGIPIADYFNLYNAEKQSSNIGLHGFYYNIASQEKAPASNCIDCGICLDFCTQRINIPDELKNVVEVFEKKEG